MQGELTVLMYETFRIMIRLKKKKRHKGWIRYDNELSLLKKESYVYDNKLMDRGYLHCNASVQANYNNLWISEKHVITVILHGRTSTLTIS